MEKPILDAIQHIRRQRGQPQLAVVRQPQPDVSIVLHSCFGQQADKVSDKAQRIFLCGEPNGTKDKKYDLIVDCKRAPHRRRQTAKFVYYPFYVWSFYERFQNTPADMVKAKKPMVANWIATKPKFCAFMYSNKVRHRNRFFDRLNRAMKHAGLNRSVQALGKCKNPNYSKQTQNPEDARTRYIPGVQTYNDVAVQKYRPFRFVLAIENTINLPGYITEKIISPMLAGAIPIYWGAKEVSEQFNEKSFINVNRLGIEGAIAAVIRLEKNPHAYRQMLSQPWFKGNSLPTFFKEDYLRERLSPHLL